MSKVRHSKVFHHKVQMVRCVEEKEQVANAQKFPSLSEVPEFRDKVELVFTADICLCVFLVTERCSVACGSCQRCSSMINKVAPTLVVRSEVAVHQLHWPSLPDSYRRQLVHAETLPKCAVVMWWIESLQTLQSFTLHASHHINTCHPTKWTHLCSLLQNTWPAPRHMQDSKFPELVFRVESKRTTGIKMNKIHLNYFQLSERVFAEFLVIYSCAISFYFLLSVSLWAHLHTIEDCKWNNGFLMSVTRSIMTVRDGEAEWEGSRDSQLSL